MLTFVISIGLFVLLLDASISILTVLVFYKWPTTVGCLLYEVNNESKCIKIHIIKLKGLQFQLLKINKPIHYSLHNQIFKQYISI